MRLLLQSLPRPATRRGSSRIPAEFTGLSPTDYESTLEKLAAELEEQSVLLLVASYEAAIRSDFIERARLGPKDPVYRRWVQRHRRSSPADPERVQLEEIMRAWGPLLKDPSDLMAFNLLLAYRHCLAHGRWWHPTKQFTLQEATVVASKLSRTPGFPLLK